MPSHGVRGHLIRRTAFHTYCHRGSLHYPAAQYPSLAHNLLKHPPAIKDMEGKNPVPYFVTLYIYRARSSPLTSRSSCFCHKLRIQFVATPVLGRQGRRLFVTQKLQHVDCTQQGQPHGVTSTATRPIPTAGSQGWMILCATTTPCPSDQTSVQAIRTPTVGMVGLALSYYSKQQPMKS